MEWPEDDLPPLNKEVELENAPITIEGALYEAVRTGRMSIKECQDCIEAYQQAFNG